MTKRVRIRRQRVARLIDLLNTAAKPETSRTESARRFLTVAFS